MPRIYGLYGHIGTLICLLSLAFSTDLTAEQPAGWNPTWTDAGWMRVADRRLDPLYPSCLFLGDTTITGTTTPMEHRPVVPSRPVIDRHQRPTFSALQLVQIRLDQAIDSGTGAEKSSTGSRSDTPATLPANAPLDDHRDDATQVRALIHVPTGGSIQLPAESDPYWQYYADCDYWDIQFSTPPAAAFSERPQDDCRRPLGIPAAEIVRPIRQATRRLASATGRGARRLVSALDRCGRQIGTALEQNQFRWIETRQTEWRLERRPASASLSVLTMRLALHQVAQPGFLQDPLSWCQDRLHRGAESIHNRLQRSGLDQFAVRFWQASEARRLRQEQLRIELTRRAARKVNWYAFQLHRLAVAIERQAASEADVVSRQVNERQLK